MAGGGKGIFLHRFIQELSTVPMMELVLLVMFTTLLCVGMLAGALCFFFARELRRAIEVTLSGAARLGTAAELRGDLNLRASQLERSPVDRRVEPPQLPRPPDLDAFIALGDRASAYGLQATPPGQVSPAPRSEKRQCRPCIAIRAFIARAAHD